MNNNRIYLKDYIENISKVYHRHRASFERFVDAIENEQKKWKAEEERGWGTTAQKDSAYYEHNKILDDLKSRLNAVETMAKSELTEMIKNAEETFDRHYRVAPDQVDQRAIALLNSGVLTDKDLVALAEEYEQNENYTMRKLVGVKLIELGREKKIPELVARGNALKTTPGIHNDALKEVETLAFYSLRANEPQLSASFHRRFDTGIEKILNTVQDYSIPQESATTKSGE